MQVLNSTVLPSAQGNPHTDEWIEILSEVKKTQWGGQRVDNLLSLLNGGAIPHQSGAALAADVIADTSLPEESISAIATHFQAGDVVELRALDPLKRQTAAILCVEWGGVQNWEMLVAFVRRYIGKRNLYFGINSRKSSLAGGSAAANSQDITCRRSFVVDLDNKDAPACDPDWSKTLVALAALNPQLVMDSGNGKHVWFNIVPISGVDLPLSVSVLADGMAAIGADNMADLPRISRLPFTINIPDAVKRQRGSRMRLACPAVGATANKVVSLHPPTAAQLANELKAIAAKLGLPGRGQTAVASAKPQSLPRTGEKTPWPAPSGTMLTDAVKELPNDQGHFDNRDEFSIVAHAIKGAALAGNCENNGLTAYMDFAGRWNGNSDPQKDAALWDSIHKPHVGWGKLMEILERVNPAGRDRIRSAEASLAFQQGAAATKASMSGFVLKPAPWVDPSRIPPREWLYGRVVLRNLISVLVAPGGAGKSALAMSEAIAMATGRELLSGEKPHHALKVWMHNAEDGQRDQLLRRAAAMKEFGLSPQDLGDRLYMTSGRDMSLQLARLAKDGPEIVPGIVDEIVRRAKDEAIDVLVLDPLGAVHSLPENSNEATNLLLGALREIAEKASIAIILIHHAGKAAAADMNAAGVGASRGASALTDGARVVRQIVGMTSDDARRLGIAECDRRRYFRVDNGKANMAPAEDARWVELRSVKIGNRTSEYPNGDEVGVAVRWLPPAFVSGTGAELAMVHTAIAQHATTHGQPPRLSDRSPEWAGWVVASALGLDTGGPSLRPQDRTADHAANLARVRGLLKDWINAGALVQRPGKDKARRDVECVDVGVAQGSHFGGSDAPDQSGV